MVTLGWNWEMYEITRIPSISIHHGAAPCETIHFAVPGSPAKVCGKLI